MTEHLTESAAVRVGSSGLPGEWVCPPRAEGLVVFAHASGSGHGSLRNRFVAGVLHQHRLATLLFDLLAADEAQHPDKAFDIDLLSRRLVDVLDGLRDQAFGDGLHRVGLLGTGTGAAAALRAATERPGRVSAVVSRGGRGDLAAAVLPQVRVPTFLIVGGSDRELLKLNRNVLRALQCEKRLEVVPGATHLFDEPGALDAVAHLAADWFLRHGSARGVP